MEKNMILSEKSRIQLELNNSGVYLNCNEVQRTNQKSAAEGKQEMVAGKSYYHYQDVSCNNRNMWWRMIYAFIAFFQC